MQKLKKCSIAINGLTKALEDIDACIRGRDKKTNSHDISLINTERDLHGGNNNNVKRIKSKGRSYKTSTRPKGVLERQRKKKKITQVEPPSQNLDYELPSFQSTQVYFSPNLYILFCLSIYIKNIFTYILSLSCNEILY